jgi:hypothetical protein
MKAMQLTESWFLSRSSIMLLSMTLLRRLTTTDYRWYAKMDLADLQQVSHQKEGRWFFPFQIGVPFLIS